MMLKIIVLIVTLLGLIHSGVGQIVQSGQCEDITPHENFNPATFDPERFTRKWYEFRRSANPLQSGDCSSFEFTRVADGYTIRYPAVNANFQEETFATATHAAGTATLTVRTPAVANPFEFKILRTDYNGYAIAYNCRNLNANQRSLMVWELLPEPSYTNQMIPALVNTTLLTSFGILVTDLRNVDHSDSACYVLPVIPQGQPIILPGSCNQDINVVQNFDPVAFSGVWHETAAYYSENSLNQCSRAQYTLVDGVVQVLNSQVINQTLFTISGTATVTSTDGSAKLSVELNVGVGIVTSELFVLATDYTSYAISYTCVNLPNNQRRVFSWILSRSRQLTGEAQVAVNRVIASELVLNNAYYTRTDQSNEACFYFPEPDPNIPVIFRGQCDENIPVVTNFNPVEYTGIWHDIESYPAVFQTGKCRNAEYNLVDGVVDVLNTQVLGESLDTIRGTAVVAYPDGTGRLNVTFPVVGTNITVTTNYWILATDYSSYSFVYSCLNLNADEKQVFVWKLSRKKTLTPAASTAINNIMNNFDILDQRYFVPVDQSREGCFFFPEPQPGVPVVFPGQCDTNTPVVQNFILTQFAGTWFEIEAYPKEQQQGQCVNHEYTSGLGNTLDLTSSQVIDQFLVLSNGVMHFTTTDNSARMNIYIDGLATPIPFWILTTDYSDYALAYSCVNRGIDFRAIYSWKLSRTRQLSANARNVINNTISSMVVLDEKYYEPIGQTLDDCFYLPDLAPGEPVILVGQCDQNIPVVNNFNASAYLGTWRLIESYPSERQGGTCNEANYSPGPTAGTVTVFNTQVINQNLASITGQAVASPDGSGKLVVTFPSSPQSQELWILDTDYTSYSIAYSCVNLDSERRRVWSWKLSRSRSLTESANNAINMVINSVQVLNNRYFQRVDQSDAGCFYFPEPDFSASGVTFRGQCDENIAVVQQFNVSQYLGTWRNIELYPSVFQGGSCNTAQYSLGDGVVNVLNSQVVNQSLSTINGFAVVSSDDESAKLTVTFPGPPGGPPVTSPLWVLTTDYSSYALTYTCFNIDEYYRRVWSWKLSRTRTLTPSAVTAIENAARNINVLSEQYFRTADHSDNGCFYYPTPVLGQPVRFRGQCSSAIPVVQNFNLTQFAGTWHEIQAYPKRQQQGECVNHQYSTGTGNTLSLRSLNVINQTLNTVDGTMRFASTDSSARMTITINSNGQIVEIPFWILNTDYSDFALAYACENDGPEHRYVYSWKLSRTRALSMAGAAAIRTTIDSVDVLDERYYERIDQSPEACFFLPDVPPGVEVVFPGQCDINIPVIQNFRPTDYVGRWFLLESYPSIHQRGTCNDAFYSAGANNVVNVLNTQVVNQALATISGTAVPASSDGSGKLLVSFPSSPTPSEYWILDTDYSSYSLVYSCRNINSEERAVWSWKLSRTRTFSQNATDSMNTVINSINVLDNRYFYEIDRSEAACFYLPEPDFSRPIRFRGRCDQTIDVVRNFDAARYLGVWHNIEVYPTNFQLGACNNARYSLGSDGVIVFNTEVINQTLASITGLAVPVPSPDGSAILNVTFPTTDLVTPYWVLATDYNSYSLVYSCVEIDEEYKNIWSWKLSRTRQLSNTAATAIQNVVNRVPVLDSRYYRTADQSPEACFYYPEPREGQIVRFPGRCNNNITVVQNFNMTRFAGVWHEIEAYPKEQQQGQCVNHRYSSGAGSTLDLISSSVSNLILSETRGNMRFTSTDGSARLAITITNSAGQAVEIPFWILDTDYDDYALAYACVDELPVNDMDYRRVFSWKLSKSRTLSANGRNSINAVINTVDVLDQRYYENIDQSADACFFLPNIPLGQPVIFPGQCDPNLPVVQNFNRTAYLGRWRSIENYYSDFQAGGCNEATYSQNANNLEVVNTVVVNQNLITMNGVVVPAADGSGRLEVTFPNQPTSSFWILDTDYENYSLVYSCMNLNNDQRRVWALKLSRERTLSSASVAAINQVVQRINVLDNRYFAPIPQNDAACFYFPEPDGSSVVFRGQCDENIRVVTGFNAERYTGTWYDIESYPAGFQGGTCNTAQYTLNGGVVEVLNTQVVDQELDSIRATAVPAVADGSAKLIVTFPAGPNNTIDVPYWVIDTDYDNYSLVYSCTNIDTEKRRVTSWKLSRTQFLSNDSIAAIDTAMSAVPVIDQRYFLTRDHSFDGCFFYPDNNGGPIIFTDGQCPSDDRVNVVTNFNAGQFAGTWHEVARFPSELQTGACAANTLDIGAGGANALTHTIVYNERQQTLRGSAIADASGRGIISVRVTAGNVNIDNKLYVIATDYSHYALMYACRTLTNTSRQVYSWKLTRTRAGLSESATATINTIVRAEVDLHRSYYDVTPQDNDACFFYPEFDQLPNSIQLPGPCPVVPAVPNFNLQAYLGNWFEVQRYPQPNQRGRCNRARYSALTANSFGVFNYQVLNTALSTISGDAVITSTDGSAQLTVTLMNGQRVNTLSVLATDYTNYALLYNCRNLDDGNRQVASWKFSRTRSLSADANTAINAVIARTQGLRQEYYFDTNQTPEACFYVPALDLNQAPRFRARCEDFSSGMQNFNIQQYLGWWHEIESYPADENRGDCVSARYSGAGNLVVYDGTAVFNLTGVTTTGGVVATSDGRLRKTVNAGTYDMWVLATDYQTYSLVFSCENIDDEYVRVWSAKYSKTRQLTPAAQTAMESVIANHQLLYPQFYQPVDQSDQACFHYPQQMESRVVLPGQCDQNIPVQNEFNIGDYTGTWYQIERYPYLAIRDNSTCIGARYTIASGSDEVAVLNWEVNDGRLNTIEGRATAAGNARLTVTLQIPDTNITTTTDLYVLRTDYVSYSLVYTCENINPFQRVVVAMKLSRTRTLPAEAVTAINSVMDNRPELHQPYFISVEQRDDCDEPSSSYLVKSSIFLILLSYALHMLM